MPKKKVQPTVAKPSTETGRKRKPVQSEPPPPPPDDDDPSTGDVSGDEELAAMFDGAEPASTTVPDGKYQVTINEAFLNRSSNGRPQVNFKMTIINGPQVNRTLFKRDGIDNEESVGWFKAGMARIGIEVPRLKDLPTVLESLADSYAEVTVKNKEGGFTNVYFNKALDSSAVSNDTGGEPDETAPPDETPSDTGDWKVGDECNVEYDDETLTGTIAKIAKIDQKTGKVRVDFPDDSYDDELTLDDLKPVEDDDDGVSIGFDAENMSDTDCDRMSEYAKSVGLDPDQFDTWSDLIKAIADEAKVSGPFKSVAAVHKAFESLVPKKRGPKGRK